MPKDNRRHSYNISLNEEEYKAVEKRRETTGLCKTKFGRQQLIGGQLMERKTVIQLSKLRKELNKNGSNFNQLLKKINSGNYWDVEPEILQDSIERANEIITTIQNIIKA